MSYPTGRHHGTFAGMNPENLAWRGTISIQKVLAEIRSDSAKPFWVVWVRATGKQAGSVKVVSRALYGAPKPHLRGRGAQAPERERNIALHTEKGTLPLTDTTTGEYKTPLISHIIGYNLMQVIH